MRVLFVSLELLGPIFSGNGTYSRSLVRALKAGGLEVGIVSGRREDVPMAVQDEQVQKELLPSSPAVIDIPIPVAKWGKLDYTSGWREFQEGCKDRAVIDRVEAFDAAVVFCVDWSGYLAWQEIAAGLKGRVPRVIWLNYRVFSNSATESEAGNEEVSFYRHAEGRAAREATAAVALCRGDARALACLANRIDPISGKPFDGASGKLLGGEAVSAAVESLRLTAPGSRLFVLLPALRRDVAELAFAMNTADQTDAQEMRRILLSCCVRLSQEKQPHRFGRLIEALQRRSDCHKEKAEAGGVAIVPFLCGSAGDKEYAEAVRSKVEAYHALPFDWDRLDPRLLAAVTSSPSPTAASDNKSSGGSIVCRSFLTAADMSLVFAHSLLNCHPCSYDAFGMTIVEAASFGCPTLVVPTGKAEEKAKTIEGGETASLSVLSFTALKSGFLRVEVEVGARSSAASSFPTVGALDLLGEPLLLGPGIADAKADGRCTFAFPWSLFDGDDGKAEEKVLEELLFPLLSDEARHLVAEVASNAKEKALSWTERELSEALVMMVKEVASATD